jgi:cytochrome c-type biogenesis protein CcmH
MRALIRAHIRAGESDDAIKQFLVARYGDFILMRPPFDAQTYALWLTPFAVLILAAGVAIWVVVRAAKPPQGEA